MQITELKIELDKFKAFKDSLETVVEYLRENTLTDEGSLEDDLADSLECYQRGRCKLLTKIEKQFLNSTNA